MKMNLLKTLFVSTTLVGATFLAACDEEAGIVVGIPQTQEVIYKIDPISGTTLTRVDTIGSDLDSMLSANKATRDDIESIELTGLALSFTDSNGVLNTTQNFNNIKNISIGLADLTGAFTSIATWDSTLMATTYQNQNPITSPAVTVLPDLLPYVSLPNFRVQLTGAINTPTTDTRYIKSTMTIKINVKL